jgi:hypothetical protein
LRGNREVEHELRDDGGLLARAIAHDVKCFSEILNAELHGVISIGRRMVAQRQPVNGGFTAALLDFDVRRDGAHATASPNFPMPSLFALSMSLACMPVPRNP